MRSSIIFSINMKSILLKGAMLFTLMGVINADAVANSDEKTVRFNLNRQKVQSGY